MSVNCVVCRLRQTEFNQQTADLEQGKELVGELLTFLNSNVEEDGEGSISITTADTHGDALCALLNAASEWAGVKGGRTKP